MSHEAGDEVSDSVRGEVLHTANSQERVSFNGARRAQGIALSTLCSGLAELADLSSAAQVDPLITSVTLDVDEVEAGCLFIARELWYVNTHTQLLEAVKRGAAALLVSDLEMTQALFGGQLGENVENARCAIPIMYAPDEDPTLGILCDRFYDHPTRALKVYGVTGTNGKTSAVSYLMGLLRAVGERVAVIGTVAYAFEEREISAPNTTPDALVIHRFAREALDLGASALALEVSSHALSLGRVAGVSFNAVGFTSWGRDHLDFHGTIEAYRDAKASLFGHYLRASAATRSDALTGSRLRTSEPLVAVAHDDEMGRYMLAQTPPETRLVSCEVRSHEIGAHREGHTQTGEYEEHEEQRESAERPCWSLKLRHATQPTVSGVTLSADWQTEAESRAESRADSRACTLPPIEIPLIGDYHPSNLAIALGMVGATHPMARDVAWSSLSEARGVPGRMEAVELPDPLEADERRGRQRSAFVDYAHTPDAITRATSALRAVHDAPLSVIIGCGGDRDRGKRPAMVRAALSLADQVWLTSDNPRRESPEQIIADALELSNPEVLRSALESGEAELDGSLVRVVIDRRACIAHAWRELEPSGALLIMGKGHERYQEVGDRRYALHDVEALRAAAWAEASGTSITEVPYLHSSPSIASTLRSVDLSSISTATARDLSLTLFAEAAGRPQGISFLVASSSQVNDLIEPESTLIIDVDHLKYDHPRDLSDDLSDETAWLVKLTLSLLQGLTPVRSLIALISDHENTRAQLELTVDLWVRDLSERSPHLRAHQLTASELPRGLSSDAHQRGGWPKTTSGPKIPSLSGSSSGR